MIRSNGLTGFSTGRDAKRPPSSRAATSSWTAAPRHPGSTAICAPCAAGDAETARASSGTCRHPGAGPLQSFQPNFPWTRRLSAPDHENEGRSPAQGWFRFYVPTCLETVVKHSMSRQDPTEVRLLAFRKSRAVAMYRIPLTVQLEWCKKWGLCICGGLAPAFRSQQGWESCPAHGARVLREGAPGPPACQGSFRLAGWGGRGGESEALAGCFGLSKHVGWLAEAPVRPQVRMPSPFPSSAS